MRGLYLFALLSLGACDRLFGLTTHPDPRLDDGGPVDAAADGGGGKGSDGGILDGPPDVFGDLGCPTEYKGVANGTSLYRLVSTPSTWMTAQADCVDDQLVPSSKFTHLTVMGEDTERSTIYSGPGGSIGALWTGLTDLKNDTTFRWVTDENTNGYPPVTGSPWASAEPSYGVGEDCVVENTVAEFDDVNCSQFHYYVCECDSSPNDPTNYN